MKKVIEYSSPYLDLYPKVSSPWKDECLERPRKGSGRDGVLFYLYQVCVFCFPDQRKVREGSYCDTLLCTSLIICFASFLFFSCERMLVKIRYTKWCFLFGFLLCCLELFLFFSLICFVFVVLLRLNKKNTWYAKGSYVTSDFLLCSSRSLCPFESFLCSLLFCGSQTRTESQVGTLRELPETPDKTWKHCGDRIAAFL